MYVTLNMFQQIVDVGSEKCCYMEVCNVSTCGCVGNEINYGTCEY